MVDRARGNSPFVFWGRTRVTGVAGDTLEAEKVPKLGATDLGSGCDVEDVMPCTRYGITVVRRAGGKATGQKGALGWMLGHGLPDDAMVVGPLARVVWSADNAAGEGRVLVRRGFACRRR